MVSTDFPRCSLHAVGWARRVLQKMEVQITHTLSKHNLVATSTIKHGKGVCHLLEATLPPLPHPGSCRLAAPRGKTLPGATAGAAKARIPKAHNTNTIHLKFSSKYRYKHKYIQRQNNCGSSSRAILVVVKMKYCPAISVPVSQKRLFYRIIMKHIGFDF